MRYYCIAKIALIGIGIAIVAGLFVIGDFGSQLTSDSPPREPEPPEIKPVVKEPEPVIKSVEKEPDTEPPEIKTVVKEPEQATSVSDPIDLDCSGNARCFIGTVTEVIDGDTIRVDGTSIRFALASAQELDEFEGELARELIYRKCPEGSTALVDEDDGQTEGSYGRIIAVIHCNNWNLNAELLDADLGYLSSEFCSVSEFSNTSWVQKHGCKANNESKTTADSKDKEDCDPAYPDFCIPSPPPDLDCKDISQKRFTVLPPDPHRFDGDKDGIGCES